VTSLSAQHRWCLTGTPIQNTTDDLGALVTFIQVPLLDNAISFRKLITNQAISNSRDRFKNLQTLLQAICLRRTRDQLGLPDPVPHIRKIEFTPEERHGYEQLGLECRRHIDMSVSGRGKKLNSTVLESLLRLRLFCNNGAFQEFSTAALDGDEVLSFLQLSNQSGCVFCNSLVYSINDDPKTDGGYLIPSCRHLVCRKCQSQYDARQQSCPLCVSQAAHLTITDSMREIGAIRTSYREPDPAEAALARSYPSKLLELLQDIKRERGHKRYANGERTADAPPC